MIYIILYYLLATNLLTFFAYGLDKWKAVSNRDKGRTGPKFRRVSEAALLSLAILGGSPAALFAMYLFRHKTLHKKFTVGVPLILLAQLSLTAFFLIRATHFWDRL